MPQLGPFAPDPGRPLAAVARLDGRAVSLVALDVSHTQALWEAAQGADESWAYLRYGPFANFEAFAAHVAGQIGDRDQRFFAVIPAGAKACGWVAYCNMEPHNRALEIGNVWFAPALQRSRAGTEAVFLLLDHAYAQGFNRIAWRCNALNKASRAAAQRYGFSYEGTWRQAQIVKGRWRDTCWFSQLGRDWPANRALFIRWLDDANFDAQGRQYAPLRVSSVPVEVR